MSNRSFSPIDKTLSGITAPGKSETGSDGNEEVLRIPQSSNITGESQSDCFVSYQGHLFVGFTILEGSSWCILLQQPIGLKTFVVPNQLNLTFTANLKEI